MPALFSAIVNMTLTASAVICVVLLARLCLQKAPKIYSYALWSIVLFRLLCPFSFSLPVSLFAPMADASVQQTDNSITSSMEYIPLSRAAENNADAAGSDIFAPNTAPDMAAPANDRAGEGQLSAVPADKTPMSALDILLTVLGCVWAAGAAAMLGFTAWQHVRLRRRLATACLLRGNVYESDDIDTAFVLGVINPRIYLPFGLPFDVQKAVIAHEQTHQRRGDHIVKLISYIALAIHWFNPLAWLSFKLMCADMEKSCDEAVVRNLNKRGYTMESTKQAYGKMLFALGGGKQYLFTPVSFAENDTKERVINIMKYKRNGMLTTALVIALCVSILVGCAGNPQSNSDRTDNSDDAQISAEDQYIIDNAVKVEFGGKTFMSSDKSIYFNAASVQDLTALSSFPLLESLEISNFSAMSEHNKQIIYELPRLIELFFSETSGENGDYTPLLASDLVTAIEKMPKLERLKISLEYDHGFDDSIISAIANHPGLSYLRIRCRDVNYSYDSVSSYDNNSYDQLALLKNITKLELGGVENMRFLKDMPQLTYLNFYCLTPFDEEECAVLSSLTNLEELSFGLPNVADLSFLDGMKSLRSLSFSCNDSYRAIPYIKKLTNLQALDYFGQGDKLDNGFFRELTKLKAMCLSQCSISADSSIELLTNLENLEITGDRLTDVSFLASMQKLEHLGLGLETEVDLAPLEKLLSLRTLRLYTSDLNNTVGVKGKQVLSRLKPTELQIVDAAIAISDISFIGQMTGLERLTLEGLQTADISALTAQTNLRSLHLRFDASFEGNPTISNNISIIQQNNPSCNITCTYGLG